MLTKAEPHGSRKVEVSNHANQFRGSATYEGNAATPSTADAGGNHGKRFFNAALQSRSRFRAEQRVLQADAGGATASFTELAWRVWVLRCRDALDARGSQRSPIKRLAR